MYFITLGGLSVYDGARFVNYSLQNGLANELVNDVVEIAPDSLLIATNAPSLNTLVKGKIGIFKTADAFCPVINRFFKSKNGNWYIAADQGLFLFSSNRFIKIPLFNEKGDEIGNYIDRIAEWKNFLLLTSWNAGVKEKLIVYDTIKRKVTEIDTKHNFFSVITDPKDQIWATTDEGLRFIDTIFLEKGQLLLTGLPKNFKSVSNLKSFSVLFDEENNHWFFDRESILKVNPGGEQQFITSKQGLKTINLTDLFIDREGTTWIATDGNGVAKLTNSGVELLNTLNETPAVIGSIFQEGDSTWTFNNTDNSIYRIFKNSISVFPLTEQQLNIENIYSNKEKLYLINQNKIICIVNKNNPASYKHPEQVFSEPNSKLGNGVIDPYGNIIIEITRDDESFYMYVINDKKILLKYPTGSIADQMAIDRSGRLWLITRNDQLLVFTLHPEAPSRYLQLQEDYSKELPDLAPRSIMIDKKNNVWVGTRYHGIYFLRFKDLRLDSVMQFTTKDGLTDNFVYTITCDSSNNIWAGTQTGLDKLFLKNGRYIIGNVSRNNDFFQSIHKIVIAKDNTVWALSNEGTVLKVSPVTLQHSYSIPQLSFTDMKVDGNSFTVTSAKFSFNQNNFSFSVAAPSFIDEKSILYSYLLEGSSNNNWSDASNLSTFNFINLAPAHYILKVKCEFPEDMYAAQTISYSFTIEPPWWQTWWFRIVTGIFIIGFLIAAVRFYYKRKLEKTKAILEKQQAIEKERTRIATDMHDDLGAGLSRIKFLSETIGIKKQKDEPIEEDISKIRDYSHEMIEKMGEIVWALNEKNDSLSDLLAYTRSYAVGYLSQNGISCTVEAPDQLSQDFVSGEFRQNIFLTVKEALHNIVKHSQANHVTIKIKSDTLLEILIQDDGIGFEKKNIRPYSNGLFNMEKRVKEIGGQISITSEKGTIVHISVPLKT
jgi:signal transduction histidine kinase/ligand-binding sensor domain-containing protein